MNHILYFIFALVIAGIAMSLYFSSRVSISPEDVGRACTREAKICPDGSAVGRVGPNCEFAACPVTQSPSNTTTRGNVDVVRVTEPEVNEQVRSVLTVSGVARGTWYFEATFPVLLVDWDGRIIGQGIAEAQEDWMTEAYVPFVASISFDDPLTSDSPEFMRHGTVILQKANPSGLPEHDDALEIPIIFE